MSYQFPDRITVDVTEKIEVVPAHAMLQIVVEGESSFFGNEAYKKSKEIASLVKALRAKGYPEDNITLENITIQTTSGKLLKSSSARFTLMLDKISLDLIADVLAVCSQQKNIEIEDMSYEFGELNVEQSQLLVSACRLAKKQGEKIAAALSVPLLGVYSMTPQWIRPNADGISRTYASRGMRMSKTFEAPESKLEGLDISTNYKAELVLDLKMDLRVGEFSE